MAEEGERVVLNIYDLSQGLARQLSSSLLGKVIDGIWHTGIAVYGMEYYFGGGIQRTPVGRTPYGMPLKTVTLGSTLVPKEVFEEYLNEITPRFTQATYNVLRHNCNNFTEEIAQFLVGSGIPQYILGLPDEIMSSPFGGMLLPMIQQLETSLKHNQAPDIPQQLSNSPAAAAAVPDFSGISIPSLGAPATTPSALSHSHSRDVAPSPAAAEAGIPAVQKPEIADSTLLQQEVAEVAAIRPQEGSPKKKSAATAVVGQQQNQKQDALVDARAKVQEEITREFKLLMASGTGLRASEAAALAARRVMAKHGIPTN